MNQVRQFEKWLVGSARFAVLVFACLSAHPVFAADHDLDDLLSRTSEQVSNFLGQFSEVKCTEKVTQEKLGKEDKVEN